MNRFEVKSIKEASSYLAKKLELIKKDDEDIFALKYKKKESTLKKIVSSFFKS